MKFDQQSPAAMARYSRERANREQQVRETLELKNAGWSFREIAQRHGVSTPTATKRYKKALARYLPAEEVESSRRALIDRLNTLTRSNFEMMGEARKGGDLDKYIKVQGVQMAVESRLIEVMGLQAPKVLVVQEEKIEATPQETEMQKLLAQARAANEARRAAMGIPTEPREAAA